MVVLTGNRPRLEITEKKVVGDSTTVILSNEGAGHGKLKGIFFVANGKRIRQFSGNTGNSLFPGDKREFVLPGAQDGKISIGFD